MNFMVRLPGFEPGPSAWQAEIIPLDYSRLHPHRRDRGDIFLTLYIKQANQGDYPLDEALYLQ